MRFWLTITWRHTWAKEGMDVRAFDDKDRAESVARSHNAVLIEIFQNEKDFQTYMDIHDYEFENTTGEPQPADWIDETTMSLAQHAWVTARSPIIRVGRDISRKNYEAMVARDG